MKVRVFYPNKDGKIEFTRDKLEKLLDEVYEEGRAKGFYEGYESRHPVTITYPYTPFWYTTTTTPTITCNGGEYSTISSELTTNTTSTNWTVANENGISIGDNL